MLLDMISDRRRNDVALLEAGGAQRLKPELILGAVSSPLQTVPIPPMQGLSRIGGGGFGNRGRMIAATLRRSRASRPGRGPKAAHSPAAARRPGTPGEVESGRSVRQTAPPISVFRRRVRRPPWAATGAPDAQASGHPARSTLRSVRARAHAARRFGGPGFWLGSETGGRRWTSGQGRRRTRCRPPWRQRGLGDAQRIAVEWTLGATDRYGKAIYVLSFFHVSVTDGLHQAIRLLHPLRGPVPRQSLDGVHGARRNRVGRCWGVRPHPVGDRSRMRGMRHPERASRRDKVGRLRGLRIEISIRKASSAHGAQLVKAAER